MLRDTIRDRVFSKKSSSTTIMVGDAPVVVRSPTVAERSLIIDRATQIAADGTAKMDFAKLQLYAVIFLAHDTAGTRIFEEREFEHLAATPVDDELDVLINACVAALKVKKEDHEAVGNK